MAAGPQTPQALYERMAVIRAFEETLLRLFSEGKLFGTTHTCIGQEATAVAVAANLSDDDLVFASHRCHGHFIACGGPPERLMAEIMGKEAGVCRGRGGSQHLHHGRFFSSGVQGGIVGNAVGAALAGKLLHKKGIVVVFLGDGTLGQGLVYESLNFASLKQLPVLFVIEDNGYAQTTPVALGVAGSMIMRGQAFGIDAGEITSNDAVELSAVFEQCVARVRALGAPFFQVVHTYRMGPHSKGDDFRDAAEIALWRDEDPLVLARRVLAADEVAAMDERARAVVAACVSFADGAPAASHAFEMPGQVAGPPMEPPFAVTKQAYIKNINGALHEILGNDPAAFVMGEDLLDPYGGAFGATRGLSTQFPDRVITTPISEAGIAAWGVGGALEGGHPIIEIMFGDFLALAADQLLNHAPKYAWVSDDGVSVPMVVRTPMGGGRGYGPSHSQSIEKMFLGIPGLTVVAPSHLLEPGALLKRAAALKSPVLFIEHKLLYPRPVEAIVDGRMGDFYVRATQSVFPTLHLSLAEFERPDVAIVAYGGMTPLALELASALLHKEEVVADVIVPAQLSPMPTAEIAAFLGDCPVVITIEEGQKECGWGAEVVASIAGLQAAHGRRFLRFAAAYSPVPAAGSLEKKALPNLDVILAGIKRGL